MSFIVRLRTLTWLGLAACGAQRAAPAATSASSTFGPLAVAAPSGMASAGRLLRAVPLPSATPPLFLDYLAIDRLRGRIWIPIGNDGTVDVYDSGSRTFARVEGFKTAEKEVKGKKRLLGPSAAAVGDGVVYVGDRASSEVCAVDATTLAVDACATLPSPTDGVAFIAPTKEVWVTTPHDQSLTVLDASDRRALKLKTVIRTPGSPEGFASDEAHGLFFTNLEDKGSTLVIDVAAHRLKATWNPRCASDGPRGLAFAASMNFLVVACTDHVQVLDAGHDGAPLGKHDTGMGVDNLDYVDSRHLVYAAAGKSGILSVFRLDAAGELSLVASTETAAGARNAVADSAGNAYVAAPQTGQLLVVPAP